MYAVSIVSFSYVKLDWCIKSAEMRTPTVRQRRTTAMAHAMNKTGRPMWLTFHCTYGTSVGSFQEWCAKDGNSWRIGPDHHDNWDSLDEVIQILGAQAEHGRPFRWNDPGSQAHPLNHVFRPVNAVALVYCM